MYTCICPLQCIIFFEASHWPSDCGRINQEAARWQDETGSSLLAGSTRYQIVEMEMEMKMMIKMKMKYKVIRCYYSSMVDRFSVSCMHDFSKWVDFSYGWSIIGEGSAINWANPSSIFFYPHYCLDKEFIWPMWPVWTIKIFWGRVPLSTQC